jgi:CheY-like chemotaxis protein
MQGDREKTLAAGFNGYLAKPVSLVNLREEITRLLQVVKEVQPRINANPI